MHHPIVMMWVAEERRRDLLRDADRHRRQRSARSRRRRGNTVP